MLLTSELIHKSIEVDTAIQLPLINQDRAHFYSINKECLIL